jgi:hypothetical protein
VPETNATDAPRGASPVRGPRGVLVGLLLLFIAAPTFWFGLGMHRGMLLSLDIRSRVWPWAPFSTEREIAAPALSDPVWQFVPWLELARSELRAGSLPLWNPHQNGGVPLLGNGISALGSPLVWPVLIAGAERGWNLSLLLRLLLAFGSASMWLRDLGRSRSAATLGGVAFAMSGPFVGFLEHPQTLTVAAVPLLLIFGRHATRSPTRGVLAALALSTALVLTGGHAETQLMAAILAAAVVLREVRRPRDVAAPTAGALLGAGLAAPVLLPFVEYFFMSQARLGVDRHPFVQPLSDLRAFVDPKFVGSNVIGAAATVSVTVLVLAAVGLVAAPRDRARDRIFWVGVAAVALLVTYQNPIAEFLARHTPVYWTRALLLLPLPLGYFAASGLDTLRERAGAHGRRRLAAALGVVAVVVATAELLRAARGVHGSSSPAALRASTPLLEALRSDRDVFRILPLHTFLPPDSASAIGLDDVRGYDALAPRGWCERRLEIGRFTNAPTVLGVVEPWDLTPGGAGLAAWNVKYLLLSPQFAFGPETFRDRLGLDLEEIYHGPDGRILRNRRVLPRLRLGGAGEIRIEDRAPSSWRVAVNAESSTYLTIANPFFPGWTVRVDGVAAYFEARPGDPIRVAIPAGSHRVDLLYRPASFRVGCAIAAVAALTLGVVLTRRPRVGVRPGAPLP